MKPKQTFHLLVCLIFIFICLQCEWKQRDDDSPVILPPDSTGFSEEIIPIFDASCNSSSCHGDNYAPDLTAANAFNELNDGQYINREKPDSSTLYLSIDGGTMTDVTSDLERAKILKWLQEGAHNN